ncbi:hypothetical protein [Kocuria palustris]|uniref:hypothetical protein n=1 Tax=Kocuria palustris TaxID=71999 RepID=UPI002042CDB8|nr:hypothetical protein [Kocuria palustris]MCM3332806.1 hypothetical protein [Kocuria palustris]
MHEHTPFQFSKYDELLAAGEPGDHGTFTETYEPDSRIRIARASLTIESVTQTRDKRSVTFHRRCTQYSRGGVHRYYSMHIDTLVVTQDHHGDRRTEYTQSSDLTLETQPCKHSEARLNQLHESLLILKPARS